MGSHAATPTPPGEKALGDLSIEELMNETVTSVSKREQRLGDAAAAIAVLTNDDLRRSGVTTLADALRLVPGMQVAAIDSSAWAVSARGFNSQYANKLLALVDGRTIYSPTFSGIFWDVQPLLLDDVDRIEVIRGPGGTIWGANAVNGVINVVTRSARDTQGTLIYAGGGERWRAGGGLRHGGRIGPRTHYRVYATYQAFDDVQRADGTSNGDAWNLLQAGFRLEHDFNDAASLTWQGETYSGDTRDKAGEVHGLHTLGRWQRRWTSGAQLELQGFYDHSFRDDFFSEQWLDTAELSAQHTFTPGPRHQLIWGATARLVKATFNKSNSPFIQIEERDLTMRTAGAFVQDEIRLVPDRLMLTVGTKLDYNELTGAELLPSIRLVYKPRPTQTVWSAISRAVRTPSLFDGTRFLSVLFGPPTPGPDGRLYLPRLVGNPDAASEVLWAYELGYRVQVSPRLSVDLAAFHHAYRDLLTQRPAGFVPGTPFGMLRLEQQNLMRASSNGAEVALTFAPRDGWRLALSYSLLLLNARGAPESLALELNAPTHQVVLRSAHDFTSRLSADAYLRYVDNVEGTPAYIAADLRLAFRLREGLELSLVGRNLLDPGHPEQINILALPSTEVPRSIHSRITWRF